MCNPEFDNLCPDLYTRSNTCSFVFLVYKEVDKALSLFYYYFVFTGMLVVIILLIIAIIVVAVIPVH